MTEIFTAKTIDEAKAMAVKKFGKNINEIKFKVIDEGKKGFLGIGQVDAKVEATYIAPLKKTEPKPEIKAEPKPEIKAEPKPEIKAEPKPEIKAEPKPEIKAEPKPEIKAEPKPEVKADTKKSVSKAENKKLSDEENNDFTLDDFTLISDESLLNEKVKIAKDYITSVLRAMDIEVEFVVYQNETGAVINIESNNNGAIIGRRGETLDSLQYLCSIIANKGDKEYFRITIDCLGYRNKRKDTLHQLAVKVAKSVLKSGRSQQLEPMNPYERRVIHSAISEIDGVSSRSVGEEPYRKIIISSNNPKSSKHRGQRRDDKRGGNRRNDRNKKREPMEVKAIDLSTSFEKDYKKPKPEDSMEGGLYGKIEF